METKILLIYILTVGMLSVFLTVYDKIAAKKRKTRIPERTLLILGLVGGAIPMLITMQIIRHKTKKAKFMIPLPLFSILHLALLLFCILG